MGDKPFTQIWSYRRVATTATLNTALDFKTDLGDSYQIPVGEQSNQNWGTGNDYPLGYIFLSQQSSVDQALSKEGWQGGINLPVMRAMEQRAYGWYHFYKTQSLEQVRPHLHINQSQVGTAHGLSKMPYLRESRRSRQGITGFKLLYSRDLNSTAVGNNRTSHTYPDTIAIGDYFFADIHGLAVQSGACGATTSYPNYLLKDYPLLPFFIPFRAITNAALPNVLTPGKNMAQSFLANAGTRLHPTEYSTGVAAGAAAFLMAGPTGYKSTEEVYAHIDELQELLQSDSIRSPLTWTFAN
jgi:hypothetical protein